MNDLVFARTAHVYDSYVDFWRLVELAGYPIVDVSGIDLSANVTYITTPMNGQLPAHLASEAGKARRCRIIWWNLEGHCAMNQGLSTVIDQAWPGVDACWVSDRFVASHDPRATFVVLGSDARLAPPFAPGEPEYDFTHQSYEWGRRIAIYGPLRKLVREGPSAWGEERHRILSRSKLVLNVGQYAHPIVPPLRFAVAAAYGLPVVSEAVTDPCPFDGAVMTFTRFDHLVNATVHMSGLSTTARQQQGDLLHTLLCSTWTFQKGVEAGLAATRWKVG